MAGMDPTASRPRFGPNGCVRVTPGLAMAARRDLGHS